jgi:hypothetical protein
MDAVGTLFSDQPRSTHLPHLTEIIAHIAQEAGDEYDNEFDDGDLNSFAEDGFMWENLLTAVWKQRLWTRGGEELCLVPQQEMELDGILMTPDWMELAGWTLIEAKATTRSRHKWDQRERYFWRWLMQVMGYCKALRTLRCDLYVRWTCGTWRPPVPEAWRYELTFTRQEVEDNWEGVKRARDRMERKKR